MQECQTQLCLSVYIITFITGFPTNILAFYAFILKVRRKPTPIDILLLNLTVSDLLFLIFLPFKMQEVANDGTWNMPYFLCPFSGFIFYMTIYNSTLFLTAVSVERYLGVAFPIRHSLNRRPVYAVLASIFIWVVCFMHLSIVFIMPYYNPKTPSASGADVNSTELGLVAPIRQRPNVCYENFSDAQLEILLPYRLELCVVLFCVPLVICSFCYINFIRILMRLPNIRRQRRVRAISLALGTLVVFTLCFGPYNVSHVVGMVTHKSPQWRDLALLLSTFNACLDPFIFYVSSSAVRNMLGDMLQGIWNCVPVWDSSRLRKCFVWRMDISQTKKVTFTNPDEINAL
ncbi:free fatty acid receptor 2 [Clupea harengus]|uniref:Free fatty acid receptor 2 n=1 Tax=Clupea harengus TaxID=7950 RepID=A0A6P3VYK4_CLUHA|nr:free fatty acid receptor 2 [Clupea harengus]XP_042565004.1 free fatty acid receptor 2 [Clupea harengus]